MDATNIRAARVTGQAKETARLAEVRTEAITGKTALKGYKLTEGRGMMVTRWGVTTSVATGLEMMEMVKLQWESARERPVRNPAKQDIAAATLLDKITAKSDRAFTGANRPGVWLEMAWSMGRLNYGITWMSNPGD
jgi:hypothetical protein